MFRINNLATDSIETFTICQHLHKKHNIFFRQRYITKRQAYTMLRLAQSGENDVIYGQRVALIPIYDIPKWFDDNLLIKQK